MNPSGSSWLKTEWSFTPGVKSAKVGQTLVCPPLIHATDRLKSVLLQRARKAQFDVRPGGRRDRHVLSDQGLIPDAGFGARQPGDSGQLSRISHTGAIQKASRDLAQRGFAIDLLRQMFGEPPFGQRPDVTELGLINDFARNYDHPRLQLIDRPRERFAVFDARFVAQPFFLLTLCDAPDRVEMRDHSRRDEHGFAARQLAVIDLAAPDNLVLQYPRVRTFRVFLNVVRHHGVAAPADGDVKRRPGLARIGHAGGETDAFDERLRL